jgi:hypothetical protein
MSLLYLYSIFKSEGRKEVGSLRLIWLEDAENHIQELKMKRWRWKANNREAWAVGVKECRLVFTVSLATLCFIKVIKRYSL